MKINNFFENYKYNKEMYKYTLNQSKWSFLLYDIYKYNLFKNIKYLNSFKYYILNLKKQIFIYKYYFKKNQIIYFSYNFFLKKKIITKVYDYNIKEMNFLINIKNNSFNKLNDILNKNHNFIYKNFILENYTLIKNYELKMIYEYDYITANNLDNLIHKYTEGKSKEFIEKTVWKFVNTNTKTFIISSDYYINSYGLSNIFLNLKDIYQKFFYYLLNNIILTNYKKYWTSTNIGDNYLIGNLDKFTYHKNFSELDFNYINYIYNRKSHYIYDKKLYYNDLNNLDNFIFLYDTIFFRIKNDEVSSNNLKDILVSDVNSEDRERILLINYNLNYLIPKIILIKLSKLKSHINKIKFLL